MDVCRIGDKLISKEKLLRSLDQIFAMRASGLSQQEVAKRLQSDRSFISRLEALAEVRRGASVAVIGFPLSNHEQLQQVALENGCEYTWLLSDSQRWDFIQSLSGVELVNRLMQLIGRLREFDSVIMIGSDMRIRLAEAMLGDSVVGVEIGRSPITADVQFPPEKLRTLIHSVKDGGTPPL